MLWIITAVVVVALFIIWRVRKTKKKQLWSRDKGLMAYNPQIFDHHYIYIDRNATVAIILPKADETVYILTGGPARANRLLRYNVAGKEVFEEKLDSNKYEWKIDNHEIHYRAPPLRLLGLATKAG